MDKENVAEMQKEETKIEPTTPTALNLIEQAKAIRDEIKAENDRREALLRQEQELTSIKMLSGSAEAGKPSAPAETEEERIKRETREFFKGSAIERYIK